jgi:hypothetical protein
MAILLTYLLGLLVLVVPDYSHETEHVVVDEVRTDSANHEIPAPLCEMHGFGAVLGNRLRIHATKYPVRGIVDQQGEKGILSSGIDVTGLRPVRIDNHLVKPADDEAYGSASLGITRESRGPWNS